MLPCPSTSTMSASAAALQHQPLRRAGDEVGHHRIHRDAPALDHDPRLAGGDEAGADAAVVQLPGDLKLAVIFPTLQSVPTVSTTNGSTVLGPARGDREVGRRPAEVEDLGPPLAPRLGREDRIVRQERVQPAPRASQPASSASASQLRHSSGRRPPTGAMPISSAVGPRASPSCMRADDRESRRRSRACPAPCVPGELPVEHRRRPGPGGSG